MPTLGPPDFETVEKIDLYSTVHKGLRHALFGAAQAVAAVDPADEEAVARVLDRLFKAMKLAGKLADIENARIYDFLERIRPGAIEAGRLDFERQTLTFARLSRLEKEVRAAAAGEREELLAALNAVFSVFVGEVLLHQADAELEIMPLLREIATAEELAAVQGQIFADLGTDAFVALVREIVPAIGGRERMAFFSLVQCHAPAAVWPSIWWAASSLLPAHEQMDFARVLGLDISGVDQGQPIQRQ